MDSNQVTVELTIELGLVIAGCQFETNNNLKLNSFVDELQWNRLFEHSTSFEYKCSTSKCDYSYGRSA